VFASSDASQFVSRMQPCDCVFSKARVFKVLGVNGPKEAVRLLHNAVKKATAGKNVESGPETATPIESRDSEQVTFGSSVKVLRPI